MGVDVTPVLELEDLMVAQRNGELAVRASLTLCTGAIATITGASGIGKSTLIRGLVGLAPVVGGQARFEGQITSPRDLRRYVRVVHQTGALDPRQLVHAAIVRSATLAGHDCDVPALLAKVLLPQLRDRPCGELSGGERMRVALARALAGRPRLLILDELTRGLDPPTALELLTVVKQEVAMGTACLAVTHDPWVTQTLGAEAYTLVGPAPARLRPTPA